MGYPRAGMIDCLTLLGGLLVGLFRSYAAREAEMAFLRQQLLVLKRVRAAQAQVARCRSADLRLALPAVAVAARSLGHIPAGDARALASQRLPPVLALEVPPPCRPTCGPGRDPRSGPNNQPRQPALGWATHSWRIADARDRYRPVHSRQVMSHTHARAARSSRAQSGREQSRVLKHGSFRLQHSLPR
jgi:hypothetical protein